MKTSKEILNLVPWRHFASECVVKFVNGLVIFIMLIMTSCDKKDSEDGCGCRGASREVIENEEGVVVFDFDWGEFFIERPSGMYIVSCDGVYADSLQIDGLKVIYSGDRMVICPNVKSRGLFVQFEEIKILTN